MTDTFTLSAGGSTATLDLSVGNIAKACYRAVVESKVADERMAFSDRGDTAMLDIEEIPSTLRGVS